MNRIFSIIWSKTRRVWVVASENAKRRGKGGGAIDKRTRVVELARGRKRPEGQGLVRPLQLGMLLALLASCPPASAVDYYWDIDGAIAGAGGTTPAGTWSTGGTSLSTNVNGTTATGAVTTTTADRLFFSAGTNATGAYTITVNGTQNISRLFFQEGTVNLTGGTINGGAGTLTIDSTGDTIGSTIAGTHVSFNGGSVTLTGTNTFTGSALLGGGLAPSTVILAAPGGNAISGSLLQLGGGNYSSAGFVTLGAAAQINDTATVSLFSGHYSGSSIFSMNGFDETIGGINLGHQGNGSSVTFRNGAATDATVTLVGSGTYTTAIGDRVGGRNLQNGGAGRLNVVVALTGAGNQTFAGTSPTYTGTTTVNSGTLRLWNTSAWSSNAILNGGTLNLHQTATGTPVTAGGNVATRTHSQTISGAGGTLQKTGDGTVILNGNNTYQGATAIDQGTLRAGSATAFGNNSAVTLANVAGATMGLNNFNIAVGSLAGGGTAGGNVTMGSGSGNLTVGGNNTNTAYGGVISGTGTVTKVGTGTQTLTGTNTYTGLTTVSAGTLQLGSGGNTGSISSVQATVAAGASLAVNRADAFALTQTVTGDGTLVQRGAGATTMTANSDVDHVVLEHGRLVTPGALTTDDITFSNDGGATLQVAGTLQTAAAGTALVAGGTQNDTVRIDSGATMLANGTLGDGADTLDVAGILNTGASSFDLNAGDDIFVIHDNTNVTGSVLGGAGNDTLNADITASATLGVAQTFETLTKTGVGTLDITGPGISDFSIVNVNAGTLAIGAGAALDAPAGGSLTTTVAGGATLAVAGSYGCGTGNDTLTVAGTVSGAGAIDLCGGDDTLTLADGAILSNVVAINGGAGTGDLLVLNNASAFGLDGSDVVNFELLQKNDTGTATLTGTHSFTGGTVINDGVLDMDGVMETATVAMADGTVLNVDGTLQAAGATQALISGSTGINTVSVGAGGTLLAAGDLGDGDDVLDVAGTLNTGGGVFMLGDGGDRLRIHDGTDIVGTVDGGAGFDSLDTDIAGVADLGAVSTFEELIKSGAGALNINGPAPSDFVSVQVQGGSLNIAAAGALNGVQNATVASGASLIVDGSFTFTPGADTFTVAGEVRGLSTIDMLDGDDTLTMQDGADLSGLAGPIDGGVGTDTLNADIAGTATLGGAIDFETLIKTNGGTINILGPATSQFGTVLVQGGTLYVGAGAVVDPETTVVDAGATMTVDGTYNGTLGDDTFTVSGMVNGTGAIDLLAGDDVLTINDGGDISGLTNPLDGGGHTPVGDSVVLNFASDSTFSGGNVINFERLVKQNAGAVTLTGASAFSGGAALDGGGLIVAGAMETPAITLADGTVLNVGGTLQAAGATPALITGSAGINTVSVGAGGTLLAAGDLGDGEDVLDVAGTLDVGGGTFLLGDGDDNFVVHDGTVVTGAVDGGAGLDTRTYNINASADLGALVGFEGVTKTGTGVLNITGPGATDLQAVDVLAGRLEVFAGASVIATVGATLNTVVAAGATLNVDGAYGCGDGGDTMMVSGTVSGSGTIDLCGGEDRLTLRDGAVLANTISGGPHGSGDTLALDNAGALTFDASRTINFEFLVKNNSGVATLSGSQDYVGGATLNDGALSVAGVLNTPTVALAEGTVLNVDGTLQAAGATQALISGSAGINTVTVGAGGTLLAAGDLGDGEDVLDVAGTLDVGGGTFLLGDGDDNFVVHDGTVVTGAVDGGAGLDTRTYNINASADLGALVGFEGVTKTGTGVLNITGPGATDLQAVDVLAGRLEVFAGASVIATVGATLNTVVAAGATLNVDGAYGCGDGGDTMMVSGTVSGSGTIDLCGGEDRLTLRDGAVLANTISGGPHGSGDTLALDNAGALTFDASRTINFEFLVKNNSGVATLSGSQDYVGGATLNDGALSVAGVLNTPTVALADGTTLNVDGILQAAGATPALISGSAGINTVSVGAGGALLAAGDLGDGDDVLDVAGSLDTGGGVFMLGDGGDSLRIHDGTDIVGTVDGGAGIDRLDADIAGLADLGAVSTFEELIKSGAGTLNINGPAPSDFVSVEVQSGSLNIAAAGSLNGVHNATVASGARLIVDGSFSFTPGADTFTVAGEVRGLSTIDMLDGDDTLVIQDGANLSGLAAPLDGGTGGNTLVTNIAASATLGGAINFDTLNKINTGTLHIDGPAPSAFSVVNVDGGTLAIGAAGTVSGVAITTVASGATLQLEGSYAGSAGDDAFTLSGALRGGGMVDLLDGDDVFTVNTGATVEFTGVVDAAAATGDRFVLAGTGSDSFDTSLIGPVFRNFDGFSKEGAGTWRLTGTSDQDWTVSEGTLIGDSASFGGDIANAATVIFDQAFDGTFAGVLSGSGTLIKQNAGTLVVSGANTFNGSTRITAGILQVDGTLPGGMTVSSGATLSGIGTAGTVTALAGGFVAPGNPATPHGTLTLTGDYAGGATVTINTQLGDSNSATSRLVIQGGTSGTSPVLINSSGGGGAQTAGDGIAIIQIGGAGPADSFRLAQPVQAGAYEYLLFQGGALDANDWFLRSEFAGPTSPPDPPLPAYRPGVAGYVLGPQANLEYGFTAIGNMRARVGDQGRLPHAESDRPEEDAWMRVHVDEIDAVGKRFQALDLSIETLQFGTDVHAYKAGKATAHFGVMASVGESRATFFDPARAIAGLPTRAGDAETDVKGAGVYWTVHGTGGGYFDIAAQLLHYRNRYRDSYFASGNQSGWGGTLSAEIGAPFALGATNWRIEPQLQLAYQRLELDAFRDEVGAVAQVKDDALRARAGVQLFRAPAKWLGMSDASPYVALGAQRDFGDAPSAVVGNTTVRERLADTTADASVGFTGSVRAGLALHLDVRYQQSTEAEERDGVRANFGFRMAF